MKLGHTFIALGLGLAACGEVNQFTDAGTETCNDNNPCTVDSLGANGECEFVAGNAGAVCREAAGDCDVAEECTGDSTACPDDVLVDAGQVCRESTGTCDPAEACDGDAVACPDDVVASSMLIGAIGGNAASDLMVLDKTDGSTLRTIGPIGFGISGLADHPTTGQLYGTTSSRSPTNPTSLITIDMASGAGTLVGAGGRNADLDFASDGTLYSWNENGDTLTIVNPATGAPTDFPSVLGTAGSGLAFDAAGTLWFAGSGLTGELRTMNRADGTVLTDTVVLSTTLPGGQVSSLAFDPDSGVLYGVALNIGGGKRRGNGDGSGGGRGGGKAGGGGGREAHLIQIDTVTGVVTDLGRSVDGLDAIEFVACE